MMTNNNEQQPLAKSDEISEAVGYWINAKPNRSIVTVENIEHKRQTRALRRIGLSVGCLIVASVSILSLVKLAPNHPESQIAKASSHVSQPERTAVVPEFNEAQWQESLEQLRADRAALQMRLADLEKSRIQSRIERSLALAEQAEQWTSDQQKSF